eukprot:m.251908 g.251908  ORF g.251908 m.251908 type:complete len:1639 (-) comp16153_c0_seq4:63-4979(-)
MTCTVKKNWIITKVLAPVVPLVQEIASSACTSQLSIGYCEDVYYGEYCLGNGGCGTSTSLNNCGSADIYIKNKPTNADNGVTQCGRLTPIPSSECPADPSSLPRCLTVSYGQQCRLDCNTRTDIDNCGYHDVYVKSMIKADEGYGECGYLRPILSTECPSFFPLLCTEAYYGEICHANNCPMASNIDNCGSWDVYRKSKILPDQGIGFCGKLTPIKSTDCPAILNVPLCTEVYYGELCRHTSACGTRYDVNNCDSKDIYKKEKPIGGKGLGECGYLTPINPVECPAILALPSCKFVYYGELCYETGACGISLGADNCDNYDIYRKTELTPNNGVGECGYLTPIEENECPAVSSLDDCKSVYYGELCAGQYECSTTRTDLNNCGNNDVYRKSRLIPDNGVGECGYLTALQDNASCPTITRLKNCDDVYYGELCFGEGECKTYTSLNNCQDKRGYSFDIYNKSRIKPGDGNETGIGVCGYLAPIKDPKDCPRYLDLNKHCKDVYYGEYCVHNYDCSQTSSSINSCPSEYGTLNRDVYIKQKIIPDNGFGYCGYLREVPESECPTYPILNCKDAYYGEMCIGDGCGGNSYLDNCNDRSVYVKSRLIPNRGVGTCGAYEPVLSTECPENINLKNCDKVYYYELCYGENYVCNLDSRIDNCNGRSIYRRIPTLEENVCSNQGTLDVELNKCTCNMGYKGDNCQYTNSLTCYGRGEVDDVGSCSCFSGAAGDRCQYSNEITCNGNGIVSETGSCTCDDDAKGPTCLYTEEYCSNKGFPLENGTCTCNQDFKGPRCQYTDSVTCNNNGVVNDNGICLCKSGYFAADCSRTKYDLLSDGCNEGEYFETDSQSSAATCLACQDGKYQPNKGNFGGNESCRDHLRTQCPDRFVVGKEPTTSNELQCKPRSGFFRTFAPAASRSTSFGPANSSSECLDSDGVNREPVSSYEECQLAADNVQLVVATSKQGCFQHDTLGVVYSNGILTSDVTVEDESLGAVMCAEIYECTKQDDAAGRFGCGDYDPNAGTFFALGSIIGVFVFLLVYAWYKNGEYEIEIYIILFGCYVDVLTDLAYVAFEPFYYDHLFIFAIVLLFLPMCILTLIFYPYLYHQKSGWMYFPMYVLEGIFTMIVLPVPIALTMGLLWGKASLVATFQGSYYFFRVLWANDQFDTSDAKNPERGLSYWKASCYKVYNKQYTRKVKDRAFRQSQISEGTNASMNMETRYIDKNFLFWQLGLVQLGIAVIGIPCVFLFFVLVSVVAVCMCIALAILSVTVVPVATVILTMFASWTIPACYSFLSILRAFTVAKPLWNTLREVTQTSIDTIFKAFGFKSDTAFAVNELFFSSADIKESAVKLLILEFAFEAIPQIVVQSVNNNLRDSWSTISVLSILASCLVAIGTIYKFLAREVFFGTEIDDEPSRIPSSYATRNRSKRSTATTKEKEDERSSGARWRASPVNNPTFIMQEPPPPYKQDGTMQTFNSGEETMRDRKDTISPIDDETFRKDTMSKIDDETLRDRKDTISPIDDETFRSKSDSENNDSVIPPAPPLPHETELEGDVGVIHFEVPDLAPVPPPQGERAPKREKSGPRRFRSDPFREKKPLCSYTSVDGRKCKGKTIYGTPYCKSHLCECGGPKSSSLTQCQNCTTEA